MDNLAKQKEEAAQIELTDLLEIGNSSSSAPKKQQDTTTETMDNTNSSIK